MREQETIAVTNAAWGNWLGKENVLLRILANLPGQNNNFSDEYYAEKLAEKSNTFSGDNITCVEAESAE
jgi:hypothetical protein